MRATGNKPCSLLWMIHVLNSIPGHCDIRTMVRIESKARRPEPRRPAPRSQFARTDPSKPHTQPIRNFSPGSAALMRQCKTNQQLANISLGNTLCPGYVSLNGMLYCTCPGELQWPCTLCIFCSCMYVGTCTSQYPRPQLSPPTW